MKPENILRASRDLDHALIERDAGGAWQARLALCDALWDAQEGDLAVVAGLRLGNAQHWWLSRLAWDQDIRASIYSRVSQSHVTEIVRRLGGQSASEVKVGPLLAATALLVPQVLTEVIGELLPPNPEKLLAFHGQIQLAYALFEIEVGIGSLERVNLCRSKLLSDAEAVRIAHPPLTILRALLANGRHVDVLRRSSPDEVKRASTMMGSVLRDEAVPAGGYAALLCLELIGPTLLSKQAMNRMLERQPWRDHLMRSIIPQTRIFWSDEQAKAWEAFATDLFSSVSALQSVLSEVEWTELAGSVLRVVKVASLYGQPTDMKQLQTARGELVDRYVRVKYAEQGFAPNRSFQARPLVGIIIAHTDESTENLTALAYMRAFTAADCAVHVFVVPHVQGVAVPGSMHAQFAAVADTVEYLADGASAACHELRGKSLNIALFLHNVTWGISEYIELAALRVAPAQATTYVATVTTGLPSMDAYISGALSEQSEGADVHYTEQLVLKSGSAICFPSDILGPFLSDGVEAPEGKIFISGANFYKLNEDLLSTWMRLLLAEEGSRLRLYPFNPNWDQNYPREALDLWLRETASRHKVDAARIEVVEPWPSRAEMLRGLSQAHVYLDSFPHSGGLSTIDPLLVGLPVVTLRGHYQRSTQGADVVTALGRPDWSTATPDAYIAQARRLIKERPRLDVSQLKVLQESPLMNEQAFEMEMIPAVRRLLRISQLQTDRFMAEAIATRSARTYVEGSAEAGRRRIVRDGAWQYGAGFGYEEAAAPEHGLMKPFRWSEGHNLDFVIHSAVAGKRALALRLRTPLQGQSIGFVVNGERLGWTHPLPGIWDRTEDVVVEVEALAGANVVELLLAEIRNDVGERPIGIIIEEAAFSDDLGAAEKLQAAWAPLDGFLAWEWAERPGLPDQPFRWATRPSSRVAVSNDRADATRLTIRFRSASDDQIVTASVDGVTDGDVQSQGGGFGYVREIVIPHQFALGTWTLRMSASEYVEKGGCALGFIIEEIWFDDGEPRADCQDVGAVADASSGLSLVSA